ncbi:MAG: fasciclin domain-containing protein [Planctomycetes bacterium]|nr:fasciclin domain-containing protein [Planctomycetota bacterium]
MFSALLLGATVAMTTPGADVVDTAVKAGNFKTLVAAVQAAGLVDTLKSKGPFTVFAPSDEAFAKLPAGTVERLLKPENKAELAAVLTYHVVPGKWLAKDVVTLTGAVTVQGQQIDFRIDEGGVRVDGASVVAADIDCSNGVIHVLDRVILPSTKDLVATATEAGTFKTLLAAAKAAGLADVLVKEGPFTLFAPTDEAFAKLPAGTVEGLLKPENKDKLAQILKLHLVKGRVYSAGALAAGKAESLAALPLAIRKDAKGAAVNDARLVAVDLDAANGVVHVIDAVLLPSAK